ncbi:OadG family protein [Floccifex sp.]|uniref:OadG family protein n=1 Tax=Floccifex sp. TaxID=2815810 RepID=UPI002A75B5A2|nr:OadG family protein [Floccifex sp.]MDD7281753.1 OadG family protein [Erysipelotrichaceae bacterium]MDY2959005.1 OadG family protein [Floccifex sp.]
MIESLTMGEGLKIALYGFTTVFIMLALLMAIVSLLSKIVTKMETKNKQIEAEPVKEEPQEKVVSNVEYTGEIQLIDVDEKTAACLMAIVSDETKIPLENLIFKKIRLLEEN